MTRTIARNWWLLVAAAAAGVLAALALTHSGGSQATAQPGNVQLTREQLLINQRISQAAVRRSNAALQRTPRWAVVLADGELVRSRGVTSVDRTGPGAYRVTFTGDLSECAFTASQIQPDPSLIGFTGLSIDTGTARVLLVQTATRDGVAADRNFTVQVTC